MSEEYFGSTYPDIVSLFYQLEWQASLFVCQAHPHFAVHHQAVMHIHNRLPCAIFSMVDLLVLFSFPPCQAMES